jgi:hypothetical protein
MIHVHITTEFPADDLGPYSIFTYRLIMPPSFASDADEAHAKILGWIVTDEYFELPDPGGLSWVPICPDTVRMVAVWEG